MRNVLLITLVSTLFAMTCIRIFSYKFRKIDVAVIFSISAFISIAFTIFLYINNFSIIWGIPATLLLSLILAFVRKYAAFITYIDCFGAIPYGNNRYIPFLPYRSLGYFIIFCVILLLLLFGTDLYIPYYTNKTGEGGVITADWKTENIKIRNMLQKKLSVVTPESPIWRRNGEEVLKEKDKDKKRILVIGDSFVWGYGYINTNNLWWEKLEDELNSRGYDIEVIAAGRPNTSTEMELQWLKDLKIHEQVDADFIILTYVPNDPELFFNDGTRYVEVSDNPSTVKIYKMLYCIKDIFPNLYWNLYNSLQNKDELTSPPEGGIVYTTNQRLQRMLEEPWLSKYNEAAVKPLGEYINDEINVPVIMVTLPYAPDKEYFGRLYDPVIQLFNESNIKTYDMLDSMIEDLGPSSVNNVSQWGINPVDSHPGLKLGSYYSDYIANLLEKDYSEVLGQKEKSAGMKTLISINDWLPHGLDVKKLAENKWEFQYPDAANRYDFLYLPIKKDYIIMSFDEPADINEILITSDHIKQTEVFVTTLNPNLGYDDQTLYKADNVSANTWSVEKKDVTSICIHSEFSTNGKHPVILEVRNREDK